jgi:tetraacyldisaccharide 4'-kinase
VSLLETVWYQHRWYHWPLICLMAPLSLLFWALSALRRRAFASGFKQADKVSAAVVIVGNISVGGNGKTPLVIYLAQWLCQEGYRPGILSRGYGGKSKHYPLSVTADSLALDVGDEPVMMRQHVVCPMVVDPLRPRGAKRLIEQHQCNVILCDDGLQHYALDRDIEIVVMDGKRRWGNGFLLPMGPLREGLWRLASADFVVLNGGLATQSEHLMSLAPGRLMNVKYPNKSKALSDFAEPVIAAAGIGNPQRFFELLVAKQVKLKACLSFADHYQFGKGDLPEETVLMTEKDAVKCRHFAHEDWWYLPVSAKLSEQFKQQFLHKLKTVCK